MNKMPNKRAMRCIPNWIVMRDGVDGEWFTCNDIESTSPKNWTVTLKNGTRYDVESIRVSATCLNPRVAVLNISGAVIANG